MDWVHYLEHLRNNNLGDSRKEKRGKDSWICFEVSVGVRAEYKMGEHRREWNLSVVRLQGKWRIRGGLWKSGFQQSHQLLRLSLFTQRQPLFDGPKYKYKYGIPYSAHILYLDPLRDVFWISLIFSVFVFFFLFLAYLVSGSIKRCLLNQSSIQCLWIKSLESVSSIHFVTSCTLLNEFSIRLFILMC